MGAIASEEAALEALGRSTVLRCSFFNQNFTEGYLLDSVLDGVIALPAAPELVEPFLDADDIADVAVTGRHPHLAVAQQFGPVGP